MSVATHVEPALAGAPRTRSLPPAQPRTPDRLAFDSILAGADVTVSRHARERLDRRDIQVGAQQARRLAAAIDRAAAKGSRTSLVLLNELALLVRIPERVVVTAMSPEAMRDGVVTQIDSAVVI